MRKGLVIITIMVMMVMAVPAFAQEMMVTVQTNGVFFEKDMNGWFIFAGAPGFGVGHRFPFTYGEVGFLGTIGVIGDGLDVQYLATVPVEIRGLELEVRTGVTIDVANATFGVVMGVAKELF